MLKIGFVSLMVAILNVDPAISVISKTLVTSPWGKIQGREVVTQSGYKYVRFEGIPYAKPPVGDLRFAKPQPFSFGQNGVYIANHTKPTCNSYIEKGPTTEDCLYLDVYVPSVYSYKKPLKVVVFIHGGGFVMYPSDLSPEKFILKGDVILVAVHYRLGLFGFLSTGDSASKGNYGLWDQNLAIKWVKTNIASFDGDPKTITIQGESAGSVSVSFHVLAPPSKGLFQRAIMQSGTALGYWAIIRDPKAITYKLGQAVGCGNVTTTGFSTNNQDLVKCLRKTNFAKLHLVALGFFAAELQKYSMFFDYGFGPVIDSEFVVEEPMKLMKNKTFLTNQGVYKLDYILGDVNNEGSVIFLAPSFPPPQKRREFLTKTLVPGILKRMYGSAPPAAVNAVINFYTKPGMTGEDLGSFHVANIVGDPTLVVPTQMFARAVKNPATHIADTGKNRVFYYFVDYCPSYANNITSCMWHFNDVQFLFPGTKPNVPASTDPGEIYAANMTNPNDLRVQNVFIDTFTQFIKRGIPIQSITPYWFQYQEKTGYYYLAIKPYSSVLQKPTEDRTKLWSEVIPKIYGNQPLYG